MNSSSDQSTPPSPATSESITCRSKGGAFTCLNCGAPLKTTSSVCSEACSVEFVKYVEAEADQMSNNDP